MRKFICKGNFVTGEKGSYVHHRKGEAFEPKDEAQAQELTAAGLIIDRDEITVEELDGLQKKIDAARKELAALTDQLKTLQSKPLEPVQNPAGTEPSGEEDEPVQNPAGTEPSGEEDEPVQNPAGTEPSGEEDEPDFDYAKKKKKNR